MHEERPSGMSETKHDIVYPTLEEDAAIRVGIAADPDTRELCGGEIARMRPASEVLPPVAKRHRRRRRT